jgi:hypothetical protein
MRARRRRKNVTISGYRFLLVADFAHHLDPLVTLIFQFQSQSSLLCVKLSISTFSLEMILAPLISKHDC